MKRVALAAITAYQRYLSPYKGYCCAYRTCTGGPSCSALGYRAIRRHGLWQGLGLLREQFRRCTAACDLLRQRRASARPALAQRGDCDLGGCDCGSVDCGDLDFDGCRGRRAGLCDFADCCSGADGPDRSRRKPPRRMPRERGERRDGATAAGSREGPDTWPDQNRR